MERTLTSPLDRKPVDKDGFNGFHSITGPNDVSGKVVTVHLPKSSRPSSCASSHASSPGRTPDQQVIRNSSSQNNPIRNKAGGANGAIQHPVLTLYSRTPTPSALGWLSARSPSATQKSEPSTQRVLERRPEQGGRRTSSALATLARTVTRSDSPSPTHYPVATLITSSEKEASRGGQKSTASNVSFCPGPIETRKLCKGWCTCLLGQDHHR